MAGTLFYDPRPIYLTDAFEPCPGGTLEFYANGDTGTPKDVYSDEALGVSLGPTVELDAAGRSSTPIYLDGSYTVRLLDADDVTVWETDGVNNAGDSGLIPLDPADGEEGQFYGTDGVSAAWLDVLQVPDPTGSAGKYLGTDGDVVQWTAFPAATTYDDDTLPGSFSQTATSSGGFTFGNIRVQWGTDTAPTASGITTSKAVTFGTAFASAPWAVLIGTNAQVVTTASTQASASYSTATTTGFTAHFFAGGENAGAGTTSVNSTIPFTWVAVGPK